MQFLSYLANNASYELYKKKYKDQEKDAVLDSNWKITCNFLNFVPIIHFLIPCP